MERNVGTYGELLPFYYRNINIKEFKCELENCIYLYKLSTFDDERFDENEFSSFLIFSIFVSDFLLKMMNMLKICNNNNNLEQELDRFVYLDEERIENPLLFIRLNESEKNVRINFTNENVWELLKEYFSFVNDFFLKKWILDRSKTNCYQRKLITLIDENYENLFILEKKSYQMELLRFSYKSIRNTNELLCLNDYKYALTGKLKNFTEKLKNIGINKNFIQQYYEKRCVAVADVKGLPKKYFALSGFWDISEIDDYLVVRNSKTLSKYEIEFEKIFRQSPLEKKYIWCKITQKMISYEYRPGYKVTLSVALASTSGISAVKKHYSCCERKILSYIEQMKKNKIDEVIFRIKYPPCADCSQAINACTCFPISISKTAK